MVELVRQNFQLNPRSPGGPGAGVDNLLLEDDCNLLLEDDCVILLE